MRLLKTLILLISFILFILSSSLVKLILYPLAVSTRQKSLNKMSQTLIRFLNLIVGIKIELKGNKELLTKKGNIYFSQHVSYLDGLIIGSLAPSTFVSKGEIKSWPIIGLVVRLSETIFINRQNKMVLVDSLNEMINRLRNDINLIFFPEGTSTNGMCVMPFQTSFFMVPIKTKRSLIPLSIKYTSLDGNNHFDRNIVCWYGQISFFKHLFNLFKYKEIRIEVTLLNPILPYDENGHPLSRKELSNICYQSICNANTSNTEKLVEVTNSA